MRREDRALLERHYPVDHDVGEDALAQALDVPMPLTNRLRDTILGDFVQTAPYGVGWWSAPALGTSRRILISDHLFACALSVNTNLVEAALHRLEHLDYAEQESDLNANALVRDQGQLRLRIPRSRHPFDDAVGVFSELHLVGFARSIAGAFDCLGGTLTGVLGVPTNILRSDLDAVRRALDTLVDDGTEGRQRQIGARADLEGLINAAGPAGWLGWITSFRNMLIHRGRRLALRQIVPRLPVLAGPDGQPVPRVRIVRQLPKDAGRSDVEVFLDAKAPVLTEDVQQTMDGLLRSAHRLIEGAAQLMLNFGSGVERILQRLSSHAHNGQRRLSLSLLRSMDMLRVRTPTILRYSARIPCSEQGSAQHLSMILRDPTG